ncbi:ribulokinase [uncultured Agrococcus sp.]|uniref:ribulokinase n=1 Tax=uncultured Agrococcus sp. TaxID=382258 RepID=UPI0025E873EF|nr:ribulokinase [uncultured Agrococcus sp.]
MTAVIGVDFGTLSARAVVARIEDGAELGTGERAYSHGVIQEELPGGVPLGPEWALEHPNDWLDALRAAVHVALADAGIDPQEIIGLGIDTTASTPLPILADGTPLCLLPEFADRPHAWPKLWKHHAAQPQADRINETARTTGQPWLARYGGLISSEWQFAKALQVFEEDREVFDRIDHWVECGDWLVQQLTGRLVRGVSVNGYKGIVQDGSLPSEEYLEALAPGFSAILPLLDGERLPQAARVGGLLPSFAERLGLPEGIAVAVGNVDAHVTAASVGSVDAGSMLAIMGTSTCHVMNGVELAEVDGMCGVVDGGIVEGRWGYEAGQSGVGDILAWYVDQQVPPRVHEAANRAGMSIHEYLTELAWQRPVGAHGLVALDWHGGNRSVLVDTRLSGLLVGATLATKPEDVYRALVEATAFGARVIVETFNDAGVRVERFFAAGGLLRNQQLMQTYADVLRMPITVAESEQAPALGSAIHAAVAAGAYPDIVAAAEAMGSARVDAYVPNATRADVYDEMFADYLLLHDRFGRGEDLLMHRLKARRDGALL